MTTIIAVLFGEIQELLWKLKGSPFDRYYTGKTSGIKTLAILKRELKRLRDSQFISTYSRGVYDCSEMSAQLERHLENAGFKSFACYGIATVRLTNERINHMWLKVKTTEGLIIIEATGCGIANLAKFSYAEVRCADKIWDLGVSMHEVDYWQRLEVEE